MSDLKDEAALAWGEYRPTTLVELPALAEAAAVKRVLVKLENERPLGNFKSLGGMIAALRAISRSVGASSMKELLAQTPATLPHLVCASDGNHGLAVASAARRIGARATVFLPRHVGGARARRIADAGGSIVWVSGTYDDAVSAAEGARADGILLIADTSRETGDPIVSDVMCGYGLIAEELRAQLPEPPSHIFAQAGVGGLAAALAFGLADCLAGGRLIVVEPEAAACVAAALAAGEPKRVTGDLITSAEMLSCGVASAPALQILLRHKALAVGVDEATLAHAVTCLKDAGGPDTTPSGAAGLAGLIKASHPEHRGRFGLMQDSVVVLVATEAAIAAPPAAFQKSSTQEPV